MNLKALNNREVEPDMDNSYGDMGFLNIFICNNSNVVGRYLRCFEGVIKVLKVLVKVLVR